MFKINKKPDYLYHITPASNISEILNNGLLMNKSKSSLSACFLALYEDIAKNYSLMYYEKCILLKINTSFLKEDLLSPDNYELQEFLEKSNNEFNHWSECSYLDSLKICGQVAYFGDIPPEAISIIN